MSPPSGLDAADARRFPIVEFLERMGYAPARRNQREAWYISPIRNPESTPSFKIDTGKNLWFDHGAGEGGNLIDLAKKFTPSGGFLEALELIGNVFGASGGVSRPLPAASLILPKEPEREQEAHPILLSVKPLTHPALINYVSKTRGIPRQLAERYLEEVHYQVGEREYFALGWRNQSGGYELRNPYFKGCTSKDLSFIPTAEGGEGIVVFEGMMDFLSALTLAGKEALRDDVLLLNSVGLKDRAQSFIQEKPYPTARLCLDHDRGGREATAFLLEGLPQATDESGFYRGADDLNAYLVNKQRQRPGR